MNTISNIPDVASITINDKEVFTGSHNKIWNLIAHTDEGDFPFYNGITPGLRVTPSSFDKAGSQPVEIVYQTGHDNIIIKEETTVDVTLEAPVSMEIIKEPKQKSIRKGEIPSIEGASFKVIYNSGREEVIDYTQVKFEVENDTITYTYHNNGSTVYTTSTLQVISYKSIEVTRVKTSFEAGEVVNASDFEVKVYYEDGSSFTTNEVTVTPSTIKNGDKEVEVSFDSFKEKVSVNVITSINSSEELLEKFPVDSNGNYNFTGEVSFDGDVDTGDKRVNFSTDATILNLQGHTLTTQRLDGYGPLTIKNGTIVMKNKKDGNLYMADSDGKSAGLLTIENVVIVSYIEKSTASLLETQSGNIIIKNSTLNFTKEGLEDLSSIQDMYLFRAAKDGDEVYLEGVTTNTIIGPNGSFKNQKVTIINCTSTAGLYLPTSGEVTIDGGNYSSSAQSACEIKAGNVTISNATFSSTAEKSHIAATGGTSTAGYEIAIVSNKNYAGGSVTINKGVVGSVEKFIDNESPESITVNDLREVLTTSKAKSKKTTSTTSE